MPYFEKALYELPDAELSAAAIQARSHGDCPEITRDSPPPSRRSPARWEGEGGGGLGAPRRLSAHLGASRRISALEPALLQALADEVETRIQGGPGGRPLLSVPHLLSDEASCYYHGCVCSRREVAARRISADLG